MNTLLTVNAGSSSLKFRLFAQDKALTLLAHGKVEEIGTEPRFSATRADGKPSAGLACNGQNHEAAFRAVLDWIAAQADGWKLAAAVHRVVHGGAGRGRPELVTPTLLTELDKLTPLVPLHQPHNLKAIHVLRHIAPDMPQFVCYDTAFHAGISDLHSAFALPADWRDMGVRRYGFHGISYQWLSYRLQQDYPELAKGRIVAAHLGNGSSLCALSNGQSVATTMGLTALDGMPMGTRCGTIDAGAVLYLLRHSGLSLDAVEKRLYNDGGLLGLSGISRDVKALLESADPRAAFALDYYAEKAAQSAAQLAAAMGGIDAMVFTGGIGENAASIRDSIVKRLGFLGLKTVLVIPADEERMMAMNIQPLLSNQSSQNAA